MKVQQFFGEDLYELGVVHGEEERESAKVDVVCRVDSLWCAKNGVSDGDAAAEDRGVFYIVDTELC